MKTAMISIATAASLAVGASAWAGDFDGKRTLLCNTMQVFECHADTGCASLASEEFGAATQFVLDFSKKTVDTVVETPQVSRIERVEVIDDQLFVQGIEDGDPNQKDGAAWSFAIGDPDGRMVATITKGDGTAFVIEGFCTRK